ncbi:AMP-dependent synthetase [Oerskovia turbata]|uniref:AMP-dependent synthetase n=1 Tax=Oerskovia turbata TaxID=1713 RepID=A0A4Q1KUN8_9CELL|nr:AMP-binding protein [Oerskovia turbata]RXR23594.1 AMP-dependent synthetase [Oerskovia turbata]RXR32864.1 AMP-dependent synthetase [Oerskovia turbata]
MPRADGPAPADVTDLRTAVADALRGRGPALAPTPLAYSGPLPDGTALVLRTSGSTGLPREVALSADALVASARATHDRLGGDAQWLLTLPPTHVAGLQVVLRSVVAGTELVTADLDSPFTAHGFAAATARMGTGRRYVSLVPTQLHRLLHPGPGSGAALDALLSFDAILLGGAAASPALLATARDAGAAVVTTYGMTETSGGCVYDGVPLAGVRVQVVDGSSGRLLPPDAAGVVEIAGPVLATGYLGEEALTAATFRTDADGSRWLRTSDLGSLAPDGTLTVLGRADDVIVTGGVNVAPAAVEAVLAAALAGVEGLGEVCVVGVPDHEWGQRVLAVVEVRPAAGQDEDGDRARDLLGRARRAVATTLGPPAAPRDLLVVADLPRRGPGKIDRAAVTDLATRTAPRTH